MEILEEEINYISKIYRNGLNHVVEDTIPNKLICVHNIHWCVEALLRKATQDYANLSYRDGFEAIFQEFAKRHANQVPEEKAVRNFNEIRNDFEHRGIPPEMSYLKEILPKIYKFTHWLMKTVFNAALSIYTLPAADERSIFEDFLKWKDDIGGKNIISKIREADGTMKNPKDFQLDDLIFICLIPSTYSEGLVDFSADAISDTISSQMPGGTTITVSNPVHYSPIEQYFRDYRVLIQSQVYSIPKYLREYREFSGDEIRVYPDGRIYIGFGFTRLLTVNDVPSMNSMEVNKKRIRYIFNIEPLFSKKSISHPKTEEQTKYGTPINRFSEGNLEDILKIVCFPFHPDCKVPMVKLRTTYFTGLFVFSMMRFGPQTKGRLLYQDNPFGVREYLDIEDDLRWKRTFNYDEIPKLGAELQNYCYGFFKNKSDTAFSY